MSGFKLCLICVALLYWSELYWSVSISLKKAFKRLFCKVRIGPGICAIKSKAQTPHGIMQTCPCNVSPLEPHFYIAKLEYAGVYLFFLFFLFLLQNIDCGYSLEPPRRGGSNVYPQSTF